ncbi:hypothetical protein PCC6912_40290 [Chlorogloeopsis fritschii PCC 6912]|uniref:Uncharacterized protein n=1 Tax=Chlorogloeopsis fritschii PCC 6912 TaxID=211165 RepID=A0A3S0XT74_CHLFR|nr:hypothetical protein [Chlorogloeopsis fritschii]RUR77070.1 hypothetical protein PCC6912_40290 [Chlorogloeopsis fritschii PCC 6912]
MNYQILDKQFKDEGSKTAIFFSKKPANFWKKILHTEITFGGIRLVQDGLEFDSRLVDKVLPILERLDA